MKIYHMAICNIFRQLTKETGSFLTFSQYMEDLTEWQTKNKFHRVVPSKFIAIDCQTSQFGNATLPRIFQEHFENACACFKNNLSKTGFAEFDDVDSMAIGWSPEYSKTLFWNMMLNNNIITINNNTNLISGIKYVGDINLQSYNNVDGIGYSEIYCHIPNDTPAYDYSVNISDFEKIHSISRNYNDVLEGFKPGDLQGWEYISLPNIQDAESQNSVPVVYKIDKQYDFSWDDSTKNAIIKTPDKSFNINMIVVLYDIWNDNNVIFSGIPMGVYITGLVNEGKIQNSITKYVSNEDIYNSGSSYGLRICSRYIVAPNEDNYIVKDVTCEDNNYGDLSRVLSQLSISQAKMDEVVNKTYNTEQNYKNLLSIFKNSKTNVPYIKIVNNESCWFV